MRHCLLWHSSRVNPQINDTATDYNVKMFYVDNQSRLVKKTRMTRMQLILLLSKAFSN